MTDLVFAVPGDLGSPTGGYEYARRLLVHLPAQGVVPLILALDGSFPAPSAEALSATAAAFAGLPTGVPLLVDGLAYGVLSAAVIRRAASRPILALVHHPLCYEAGLAPRRAEALRASETDALALADGVITTSPFTARLLTGEFAVPAERIRVARPGTLPAARVVGRREDNRARGSHLPSPLRGGAGGGGGAARKEFDEDPTLPIRPSASLGATFPARGKEGANLPCPAGQGGREVALLAVGAVTPRKGYGSLLQALGRLRDRPWRLNVVGALDRDPAHARELDGIAQGLGLSDRVVFAGSVSDDELERLYAGSDVVVSSSVFEGYGMALAESLARGLPLVMTRGGAADETVPDGAAFKVEAGDVGALAAALRALFDDPDRRAKLADAAWSAGQSLPRWDDTAAIVAAAVADAMARRR